MPVTLPLASWTASEIRSLRTSVVSGTGFAPGETVQLGWDGRVLTTARVSPAGFFARGIKIPAAAAGTYSIVATGLTSGLTGSANFTVTP